MELTYSSDNPPEIIQTFDTLIEIKKKVFDVIVTHLMNGECRIHSSGAVGESYPYDYLLYSKESLDPNVQTLNKLIENIEETFQTIKDLN